MKQRDIHTEIKKLKTQLQQDTVSIEIALEQFVELLNEFQQEDSIMTQDVTATSPISTIGKELQERNQKMLDRIKKLNRVIILQELGVHFNTEELNLILQKQN